MEKLLLQCGHSQQPSTSPRSPPSQPEPGSEPQVLLVSEQMILTDTLLGLSGHNETVYLSKLFT